jgi:hypothetical protein
MLSVAEDGLEVKEEKKPGTPTLTKPVGAPGN